MLIQWLQEDPLFITLFTFQNLCTQLIKFKSKSTNVYILKPSLSYRLHRYIQHSSLQGVLNFTTVSPIRTLNLNCLGSLLF